MKKAHEIIKGNIEKRINFLNIFSKFKRRKITLRAKDLYHNHGYTWSEAMTESWAESRLTIYESRQEIEMLKDKLKDLFTPVQFRDTAAGAIKDHNRIMNNMLNNR